MSTNSIKGSAQFGQALKERRNSLHLTIEEAAKRAGVGTKTWSRYESGESIRQDKYIGVCKALDWNIPPDDIEDIDFDDIMPDIEEYRNHPLWSKRIEADFGEYAAFSLALGCDLLFDDLSMNLEELKEMPKGSHLGELSTSFLLDSLPEQFVTRYDYEFVYALYCKLMQFMDILQGGNYSIKKSSVLDMILLYLITEEADFDFEMSQYDIDPDWNDWIYDFWGDMDLITWLYSSRYVDEDNIYHFTHWMNDVFLT